MTKLQIKQLSVLGYHLVSLKPFKMVGGGQFAGGFFDITESQALKQLENAKKINKVWLSRFGKKLYNI